MQKGFASIEVILVVMIIAILATVAVPNAVRVVDRAAVTYEQKRLYSELLYARTLNRSATASAEGLNMKNFLSDKKTAGYQINLELNTSANSYKIVYNGKPVREPHSLSNGVTFSSKTDVPAKIWFDADGYANSAAKSKTIVLTSRHGDERKIVFDSVGRIRGGDEKY